MFNIARGTEGIDRKAGNYKREWRYEIIQVCILLFTFRVNVHRDILLTDEFCFTFLLVDIVL